MRDYSGDRGAVPYVDPGLPGRVFYQTAAGWASVRAMLAHLRFTLD